MPAYCYLLHYKTPISHSQHYLGSTDNLDRRLHEHSNGSGKARLPQVFNELGIEFEVSRLWECEIVKEARALERQLKRRKNGRKLCPTCRGS